MKRKWRLFCGRALLTIIAAVVAAAFLLPTVFTFTNSLMSQSELTANYGMVFSSAAGLGSGYVSDKVNLKFIPDKVTFAQYYTTFVQSPEYLLKFWNSVKYVLPIVLFQILIACLAAYGFTRYRGKIREVIFFFYIILMLMPYQVTLVPNYLISDTLGILGNPLAIVLPGVVAPFSVFLITKFMRRIPQSLIEAAKLDGAGEWQIFWNICLPMCRSVIYSVVILVFIDYWNMVEQPIVLLSDPEMMPLSVFLSQINAQEVGLAFAVAAIYMIPSLLLFLHGEDYLIEGITYSGAIKG